MHSCASRVGFRSLFTGGITRNGEDVLRFARALLPTTAPVADRATTAAAERLSHWYAGDGHVHSAFSRWDIAYRIKPWAAPSVLQVAQAAAQHGLGWVIVGDHEEMLSAVAWGRKKDLDQGRATWEKLKAECEAAQRAVPEVLVLPGKELGRFHPLGNHGHCLAWGLDEYADTGPRPRGRAMVEAVRAARGMGVIAHPNGSAFPRFFGAWLFHWRDWSASGYTGVELLNKGKCASYASPGKGWDRHLTAEVPERCQGLIPETTHVGIGGSDAHYTRDIGKGKTFVHVPEGLSTEALYAALRQGRCVASSGPLVVCTLEEGEIGDTVEVARDRPVTLALAWDSPTKLTSLRIIGTRGRVLRRLGRGELGTRQGAAEVSLTFSECGYVRVQAKATSLRGWKPVTRRAYTNPIWVNVAE